MRRIALAAVLILAGGIAMAADDLAPAKYWRAAPEAVATSGEGEGLDGLAVGRTVKWEAPAGESWIAARFAKGRKETVMSPIGAADEDARVQVVAEVSADSADGADGHWSEISRREVTWRMAKFELAPDAGRWLRVRVPASASPVSFNNIALYRLPEGKRADYWLFLGASITEQSVRNEAFGRMVHRHDGDEWDPVAFNLAVSGWNAADLLEALDGFLAEHPHASYVGIHIGGNDVSPNRPYPGAAEPLEASLVEILTRVEKAGKVPILSRLSYRAYKKPGATEFDAEENGSLPYNVNILDPLIRQHCPRFYDAEAGRGIMDPYTWFKAHPEELSSDGVHVRPAGEESWNMLWAKEAGGVVYGGTPQP